MFQGSLGAGYDMGASSPADTTRIVTSRPAAQPQNSGSAPPVTVRPAGEALGGGMRSPGRCAVRDGLRPLLLDVGQVEIVTPDCRTKYLAGAQTPPTDCPGAALVSQRSPTTGRNTVSAPHGHPVRGASVSMLADRRRFAPRKGPRKSQAAGKTCIPVLSGRNAANNYLPCVVARGPSSVYGTRLLLRLVSGPHSPTRADQR
jgi:hypothetical protein